MEFTGRTVGTGALGNEMTITFTINEKSEIIEDYYKIKDCEKLSISVKKYREKRSQDANAYMWVLLQKMAVKLNTSKDELYLQMLEKYGVFTHIIAKPKAVKRVKEEFRTVRELGEVTVNGVTGIQLQIYYGSSTYDTLEMSQLIDGVVNECKDLEIETLPPDEIRQMKERWGV